MPTSLWQLGQRWLAGCSVRRGWYKSRREPGPRKGAPRKSLSSAGDACGCPSATYCSVRTALAHSHTTVVECWRRARARPPAPPSLVGCLGGDARDPFCRTQISMVDGVEYELDAIGNSQLVEDAKQILLDGVLTKAEFSGDVAIAEAFGDQSDDLFLSRRQQTAPAVVDDPERRHLTDKIEEIMDLLGTGPDLAVPHHVNAFAKLPQ